MSRAACGGCSKRHCGPHKPPGWLLAAVPLHPFKAFLQGAACFMAHTRPQYPVSGFATFGHTGVVHERLIMALAEDGDLGPRDALVGALLAS